jgi:phage shock protein A
MIIYSELSQASTRTHLIEAKRDLIDLMAKEIAARRDVSDIRCRIAEYEKYAGDALDIEEELLAQEIAEKIATMESGLALQEKANDLFSSRVNRLRHEVHQLERRLSDPGERLQYIMDYLDAAAELEDGSEDRELDRKMRAAGIGKHVNAGRDVLERIRKNR